jgi:hypothetical protein
MRDLDALGGFQTSGTRWDRMLASGPGYFTKSFEIRKQFVSQFGFAVPCREMLEFVARHSKRIIEVGAGTGFMASQLRRFEIDVIATDLDPGDEPYYGFEIGTHHTVEKISAIDAVNKYSDRDLFCSWPSLGKSWLSEAATELEPGRLLFYVGESYGGCTADDTFHELVDPDNGHFERVDLFDMVQFCGISDNLWVYRRLPNATAPELIG